ncbi:Lipase, putative [Hondaea fermentalgiana]|uniref:sn-1-specific diacylglycerol lipase n=1 Tax=Hondaea fermentalgiana TaxID=2315210 RepID=A0A2R5G0E4_9STRA|nr:Lipase, putative [Hondaea fermentalgiana]|eukprot:GBG24482.1 Lipase, putative [Hondaea fermentalgiana]
MAPHDGGCSSVKAKVMVRSRSMPALSASPFVTASLPRDRTEEDASGDFEVASHASADNLGSASIGIETFFNLAVTTAISRNNNNNNNLDGDSSDEEDDGTSFFSDPHWSIKDVRTCELESSCTPSSPQSPAAVDLEHHRRNSFMSVGSGPSIVTLGDGVEALTGVPGHDVIHHAPETSAMYSPAHYVAVDHANENIVVVIRGTMHVADLLVDLVCEQVNFTCRTDDDTHDYIYSGRTIRERRDADIKAHANSSASLDEETSSFFDEEAEEDAVHAPEARGFRGKAHRGFLIAARNLAVQLYDIVQDALDDHPDYNLVVTGHSMGAGIATLLTLLWAQAEAFGARTNDMHAFAFGAPCSLCHELAQSPFTRQFVTAVVVGDDFVSRLSFSTVFEVQQAVNAYASRGVSLSVDEIRDVYRTIKRDAIENKLFSAGTVWLLDSDEFNMNPVEIDPRELLHSLEFSESFLTAHLPIRYLNAIANATTFVSPESLQDVQILNTRRPNPQDVS